MEQDLNDSSTGYFKKYGNDETNFQWILVLTMKLLANRLLKHYYLVYFQNIRK